MQPIDLETKSTEQLRDIALSPDYRDDVRRAALELLSTRGIRLDNLADWRPPNLHVEAPPSFLHKPPTAEYLARVWNVGRGLYYVWLTACNTSIITLIAIAFANGQAQAKLAAIAEMTVFVSLLGFAFGGWLWSEPMRILILRPFGGRLNRPLVRFLQKHIRFYGHIYTLADTTMSTNVPTVFLILLRWSLMASLGWLAAIARPFGRPWQRVRDGEDLLLLEYAIGRRVARNLSWLASSDQISKISCTEEYWRDTVRLLINSADLIIIDGSRDKPGIRWEISEIEFYGKPRHALYVSKQRSESSNPFGASTVFEYDERGEIPDLKRLRESIAAAVNLR